MERSELKALWCKTSAVQAFLLRKSGCCPRLFSHFLYFQLMRVLGFLALKYAWLWLSFYWNMPLLSKLPSLEELFFSLYQIKRAPAEVWVEPVGLCHNTHWANNHLIWFYGNLFSSSRNAEFSLCSRCIFIVGVLIWLLLQQSCSPLQLSFYSGSNRNAK